MLTILQFNIFSIYPVPLPNSGVAVSPLYTTNYIGTLIRMMCSYILPLVVDTPVIVNTMWIGPQGTVYNGSRTTVTYSQPSAMVYNTTLQISPLTSSDNGTYQCVGNISTNSGYVTPFINASTNVSLVVQGEDV